MISRLHSSVSVTSLLVFAICSCALPEKKLTSTIQSPEFCYVPATQLRSTSEKEFSGAFLPPRTYQPLGVFVGYYLDKEHTEYIRRLLDIAQKFKPPLKVNILIPHEEVYSSQSVFEVAQQEPYRNFVNLIPLASKETLWAQDFMKVVFDAKNQRPVIIDLPYEERDSDSSPGALSAICKIPLQRQKSDFTDNPGNGDYGGNILAFPGRVIAFGSSMTRDSFLHFKEYFKEQKLMRIKTEWLETSHIDEIFNLLPGDGTPCSFSIGYASPQLAIQILNSSGSWNQVLPKYHYSIFSDETTERTDFSRCFEEKQIDTKNILCQRLLEANQNYQKNIEQSLNRLVKQIKQANSCQTLRTVPLPQLFAPANTNEPPGSAADEARAINANTVNNVLLGKNLLVSSQRNRHFERIITLTLEKLGIETVFVPSDLVHHSSGGLHCTTSVIRGFQSQNN